MRSGLNTLLFSLAVLLLVSAITTKSRALYVGDNATLTEEAITLTGYVSVYETAIGCTGIDNVKSNRNLIP